MEFMDGWRIVLYLVDLFEVHACHSLVTDQILFRLFCFSGLNA